MSDFDFFSALLKELEAASASIPGKTAVFYSGKDSSGITVTVHLTNESRQRGRERCKPA
jgi:hypothetical protein